MSAQRTTKPCWETFLKGSPPPNSDPVAIRAFHSTPPNERPVLDARTGGSARQHPSAELVTVARKPGGEAERPSAESVLNRIGFQTP